MYRLEIGLRNEVLQRCVHGKAQLSSYQFLLLIKKVDKYKYIKMEFANDNITKKDAGENLSGQHSRGAPLSLCAYNSFYSSHAL